jgi:hypothetical protein
MSCTLRIPPAKAVAAEAQSKPRARVISTMLGASCRVASSVSGLRLVAAAALEVSRVHRIAYGRSEPAGW